MRTDTASYPATPHTHTGGREPWEMPDRRNKKGDRVGDDNYLSASAVQLEYRKSEPVTEKLVSVIERQRGTRKSSDLIFKEGQFWRTFQ